MIPVYPIDCSQEDCVDPLKQTTQQATMLLNLLNVILDDLQLRLTIQQDSLNYIVKSAVKYVKFCLTRQYNILTKITDYLSTYLENQLTEQQVLLNIIAPGIDYTQIAVPGISVPGGGGPETEPQPDTTTTVTQPLPDEEVVNLPVQTQDTFLPYAESQFIEPTELPAGGIAGVTNKPGVTAPFAGSVDNVQVIAQGPLKPAGTGPQGQGTPAATTTAITPSQSTQGSTTQADAVAIGQAGTTGQFAPGQLVSVCVQGYVCGTLPTSQPVPPEVPDYAAIPWEFPNVTGEDE